MPRWMSLCIGLKWLRIHSRLTLLGRGIEVIFKSEYSCYAQHQDEEFAKCVEQRGLGDLYVTRVLH